MAIDVVYEGTVLARGTKMMSTPSGIFVELEAPMPVGTQLTLEENGVACVVRVDRVHEGVGPGVFVTAISGGMTVGNPPAADATAAPEAAAADATAPAEVAATADITAPVEAPAEPAATTAPAEVAAEPAPPVTAEPSAAMDPTPHAEPEPATAESSVAMDPALHADEISQSGEVADEMPPSDTEPVAIEAISDRGDEHTVRDAGTTGSEAPKGGRRKGKRKGGR